ncbi:MAG: hypothetical protein IJT78_02080 [Oscillospiraceae bacterium]|nr:hypothetical protein [Oscillospiraceae bacterium]
MATIRCKGCGAFYRYEKEGCCPRCGAYNRPPVREKVDADGTVRHMSDDAFARHGGGSDKVCFETKECHERKECYEEQGRQYRAPESSPPQTAPARREKKKKQPSLGAIILTVVVVITVTNVLSELTDSDDSDPYPQTQETEYAEELPYSQWQASDCEIQTAMGQRILLGDGATLAVTGVEWDPQQSAYIVLTERTYLDGMTEENRAAARDRVYPEGLYCQREDSFFVLECIAEEESGYVFFTDDPLLLPGHIVFYYESPEGDAYRRIRITLTVQDPD